MNIKIIVSVLGMLGSIFNIVGTILVACSIGPLDTPIAGADDKDGIYRETAFFKNPNYFRWGLRCAVFGFFVSLLSNAASLI